MTLLLLSLFVITLCLGLHNTNAAQLRHSSNNSDAATDGQTQRPQYRTLCADSVESDRDVALESRTATSVGNDDVLIACNDEGFADVFPCSNIDLMSFMTRDTFDFVLMNDIWGWTDPETGIEYAIVCSFSGTHFVDLSDPTMPIYLAALPTNGNDAMWHDAKTWDHYVYIVSDLAGEHGVQIYDLTALRDIPRTGEVSLPIQVEASGVYTAIKSAHNIAINEATGFAYVVGDRSTCNGGLHMIDLKNNPIDPDFAGCFFEDGYTHDVQCVVYRGPDVDYVGHEVCFASNEDTLTIVDVSDKENPVMLSRYESSRIPFAYSHQGWLSEDHRIFFLDDEVDEVRTGVKTRTFVMDVTDLTDPELSYLYTNELSSATDHNQFVLGELLFQSNYRSGLRVIDISQREVGVMKEVGFFDTVPESDEAGFRGAWSVYPYFASGNILINSMDEGFFVVKPRNSPGRPTTRASMAPAAAVVGASFAFHPMTVLFSSQTDVA